MNRAALALALFFCLLPVLAPPDFPTQDGPSHIHNAAVLRDYASTPIYQQYYQRRFTLAGNVITEPLAIALLTAMPSSAAACKAVSVIVVAAFPLAFAWLLAAFTRHTAAFTLLASTCALSYFVQMGFWNFCYGVVLLMFALGWAARGRGVWGIAAFSLALYLSHPLVWAVFGLYCGIRALETRTFVPLLAHAPGGLLALFYMSHAGGAAAPYNATWGERLWPFYSLSFLHSRSNSAETFWALCVLVVFVALLVAARRRPDALAWTAAVCVLAGVVLPPYLRYDVETHFASRLAMLAFLLVLVWCGAREWPARTRHLIAAAGLVLLGTGSWIRFELCRQWSAELALYTQVFTAIRPGSTVLPVRLEDTSHHYSPTLHAIGLLAPKPFVNLRNYEAFSDHFPTRFRPDHAPSPALGEPLELGRPLPHIDIGRYERLTAGRVDYLLFYGPEATETRHYAHQLTHFRLVSTSPHARLYLAIGVSPLGP